MSGILRFEYLGGRSVRYAWKYLIIIKLLKKYSITYVIVEALYPLLHYIPAVVRLYLHSIYKVECRALVEGLCSLSSFTF